MQNDSILKTFLVAFLLCAVCSVFVSTSAVLLRGRQEANRELDKRKNILIAAGAIADDGAPSREEIESAFERVETQIVDFATGDYVSPSQLNIATADEYDQDEAAKQEQKLPSDVDIARVQRRAKYGVVYRFQDPTGDFLVLPVRGYGLWSTLYGFVALAQDGNEIKGLTFYKHGETPGLGGEVENKNWKQQWRGKLAFDPDDLGSVRVEVLKGRVPADDPAARFKVDGLSGATITSRGVTNLIRFWLGDHGYGHFLKKFRQEQRG